jgi:hypothetical protein
MQEVAEIVYPALLFEARVSVDEPPGEPRSDRTWLALDFRDVPGPLRGQQRRRVTDSYVMSNTSMSPVNFFGAIESVG